MRMPDNGTGTDLKKSKRMTGIVLSAAGVLLAAGIIIFINMNKRRYEYPVEQTLSSNFVQESMMVKTDGYIQLIGSFDSRDKAEEAAALYGIELDSYNEGLAVFLADDGIDINSMMEDGVRKGYPALSYNYKRFAD